MLRDDAGSMPVSEGGKLIGMITDRDIAVRGVAKGYGPETPVRELMTDDLVCARIDDDVEEVAMRMSEAQVRRLPVLDDNEQLCGIVSLGDLSRETDGEVAHEALEGVSAEGGQHSRATGVWQLLAAAQIADRGVDHRRVGGRVVALGDQAGGGAARGVGGGRSQLLDRGALFGSDLFLGHARPAFDQGFGIVARLGEKRVGFMPGAFDHRRCVRLGGGGLGFIFALQRLGFLAKRLCLGELRLDPADLLVERLADRGRHFLPGHQREGRRSSPGR